MSSYEQPLRDQLSHQSLGASHHLAHLDAVLGYAHSLQATYGGDDDILTAAVLLHDLGRGDPTLHGTASSAASADRALPLLQAIAFPADKIPAVMQAIREHDQPALIPSTIEGQILKDADFLAGFGAMGIVRSALWTGESGGSLTDFLTRVQQKMPARIASLAFPQSRRAAQQSWLFVQLFLHELLQPAGLTPLPASPYIVIEGISGSGKTTQVDLLADWYRHQGVEPLVLHEPTEWYDTLRHTHHEFNADAITRVLALLADRYTQVRPMITIAHTTGRPIIASRSYLSTLVYQGGDGWLAPAYLAWLHSLLPQPTHIILLDCDPVVALARIEARLATGTPRGSHEQIDRLTQHRERFLALRLLFPQMTVIDTTGATSDAIQQRLREVISQR